MVTKIYALYDDSGIRYIGKTIKDLNRRLSNHISSSKKYKHHAANWIKSLINSNKSINIMLVGEVAGDGVEEEIAWISYCKYEGMRLTNSTIGGEGVTGHSPSEETRIKISEAQKGPNNHYYGKHHSEETRIKISEKIREWLAKKKQKALN